MNLFKLTLTAFLLTFLATNAQQVGFEKIESKHFKRLYKLNDSLYRSEQPSKKGFRELEELGIRSVINFRRVKDHSKGARSSSFNLVQYPLKASELSEDEIIEALKMIQAAEKPVLVHCWHGSDRTGAIVAASRIVFENWTKDRAIAELRTRGFGHHEKRFSNIVVLLNEFNTERVKEQLGL